jgi:N-acylneuraminate cytidylyltransferase
MPQFAALVPMKGHSERVPNKNLREFNGQPLCYWIINTIQATPEIDEIVVDTDSKEIKKQINDFDVTVIDRPDSLCGDHVPMNDIILHDITQVDADYYLQTHCTNPLLRSETISEAIARFREDHANSLFSVTPVQARFWNTDGQPINHKRDELKRTQDLPPIYEENSNIYLFTNESVQRHENRIGDDPRMFPIDETEAIDIDEAIDFRIAEFLHRDRYGKNPSLNEVLEDQ